MRQSLEAAAKGWKAGIALGIKTEIQVLHVVGVDCNRVGAVS